MGVIQIYTMLIRTIQMLSRIFACPGGNAIRHCRTNQEQVSRNKQDTGRRITLSPGGRNKRVMILEEKGAMGCVGCTEPFSISRGKLHSIKTVAKQLNKMKKHTEHFHLCEQITHKTGTLTYTNTHAHTDTQGGNYKGVSNPGYL